MTKCRCADLDCPRTCMKERRHRCIMIRPRRYGTHCFEHSWTARKRDRLQNGARDPPFKGQFLFLTSTRQAGIRIIREIPSASDHRQPRYIDDILQLRVALRKGIVVTPFTLFTILKTIQGSFPNLSARLDIGQERSSQGQR